VTAGGNVLTVSQATAAAPARPKNLKIKGKR
jgi:hypothetical protein